MSINWSFPLLLLFYISMMFFWLGTYLWCGIVATSPIGALVCWNAARKRGGGGARPALAGMLYWACWFMPWIYYVYQSEGREFPAWLVRLGHVVLLAGWLMGPVVGGFFMVWSSGGSPYSGASWVRPWLLMAASANVLGVVVATAFACRLIGTKLGVTRSTSMLGIWLRSGWQRWALRCICRWS